MHNFIFQVSTNPIHKGDFINPDRINEGEMAYINYASELNETEQRQRIKGIGENRLGSVSLMPLAP